MDENERQEELERILEELAIYQDTLQNQLNQYVARIVTVYSDPDFRHRYSGFYAKITVIDGDEEGNLDILSQNIRILYEEICKRFREQQIERAVYNGVRKLYDHVNLDIARINYLRGINNKAETLRQEVKETRQMSNFLFRKVQKAEREYIAILGIFAAIIAAFFSGIGFSSSILANIEKATIYRLSGMVTLMGLIIFNILVLLMNFIRYIVGGKLQFTPKKFVCIVNGVLFVILSVIILGWAIDVTAIRSIWVQSIIKYFSGT